MDSERVVLVLVASVVAAGFLLGGPWGGSDADTVGEPGSEHLHAHLFFVVNGSETAMTESYMAREERVHFHGNDSVLHIHADNLDLGYALDSLDVSVNRTCLTFGLDDARRCGAAADVGITINGKRVGVGQALDRVIRQGDSIVVWYGEAPSGYDRELPPEYQEPAPGKSV